MPQTVPADILFPVALRACTLSGAQQEAARKKLVTLRELERVLETSIDEARKAIATEQFWAWAVVAASSVEVACDWAVMTLSNATGPAGKGVALGYDVAKLIVGAGTGNLKTYDAVKFNVDVKLDALEHTLGQKGAGRLTAVRKAYKVAEDTKKMGSAFSDALSAGEGTAGARSAALKQLEGLRDRIRAIEESLGDCAPSPVPLLP